MSLLTDFRSRYPIYNDIPDEDLAERLYSRFYSNVPREEFFNKVLPSRLSPEIAEAQRAATAGEEYWTGGKKEPKPLVSTMEGMVQEPEISVAEAQKAATAGTEFWARPKAATPMMGDYPPVTMPEEQPVEPQVARGRFTIPEPPSPPDTRSILEQVAGQIDPAVTRAFGDTSAAPEQIMPEGLAAYQEEQRRKAQEAAQLRLGVTDIERSERVKKAEALLAGALRATGSGAEWFGRKIDSDTLKNIAETLDRTAAALTPEDPTFLDKVAMGVGSTAAFIVPSVLAAKAAPLVGATIGVARAVGIGTSAVLESATIAQETFDNVMSETGNEDLANTQAWKAAALNLPLSYITNKFGIFSDKGGAVSRVLRTGGLEGGQETGQTILTNVLGFKPAGQGVTETFAVSAVSGGATKVAYDAVTQYVEQAPPQEKANVVNMLIADGEEARKRVYAAAMSDEQIAPLFKEAGITGPDDPKFIAITKTAGEFDKTLAKLANDPNVGPELLKSGIVDTGNPAAPEFQGAARTLEQVSQAVQNASTVDAAIAEFNQGVREAGRRAEPVELTEQQLLAQIQGVVAGEPVTPAITPVTPEVIEAKARIEAPPTGRVEVPRIEVPPTGRVEAPVAAPEAPAEVPRISVPPTGRIEAPAALPTGRVEAAPRIEAPPTGRVEIPAAAPRIEAPPTGRVEPVAPVTPAAPEAPKFTDLTAAKANKAQGIAKGEVLTFKSQKQAAAYVKSNKVRGFTPRQTEDGWVLSKPVRERTQAQIAAARQRMQVREDDDLLTALAKMGGINATNLERDGADGEDLKSVNKGSVLKPFRRTGGMSVDGAAEAMAEMGYDVYDENGNIDAGRARSLIDEAIGGTKVYTPNGYMIVESRNAEERDRFEAAKEQEALEIVNAMPAMAEDELLTAAAAPREIAPEVPVTAEIPAGAVRLEEPVPGEFIVAAPVVQQENLDQAFAQAETQVRQGSTAQYENAEPTYEQTGPSDQSAARVSEPSPEYAVRRRGGLVQLRAGGFYQTLGEQGHLGLVGQRVDSPAKLAELAQIYRNPGYETFRVFFTDQDGRIVEQTGASARLPGQANFIGVTDGTQIFSDWIQSRMEKNNAEGFYILHNHPSGDPTPSQQDADATRAIADNGFLGHIVINGNRYAKIDANGEYELLRLQKFSTQDPVRRQLMQNGVIGTPIAADADVAKIGRLFTTSEDMSVVIAQGNTGVTAIGEIPNQTLLDPQRGPAAIRRFARFNGGAQIFVYTQQANRINPNVVRLYDQGFVTDVVSGNGNSIVAERGFSPNQGTFGGTRTRPIRQLGEERAIQEPSAEALPVLPRARGGKAVGERDAQRQEAAREGRAREEGAEEVAFRESDYRPSVVNWAKKEFGDRVAPNGNPVWENFVRWFGDSQVVNEKGDPLVVYHSSNYQGEDGSGFSAFKPSTSGMLGKGIYLTVDRDFAGRFREADPGRYAMPAYVVVKNPAYEEDLVSERERESATDYEKLLTERALANGHDAIIQFGRKDVAGDDRSAQSWTNFVVLDPSQIKSSVGNNGNFSTEPSIVAQQLPPYSAQLSRWFSELERQVSQGPESMPAAQWKGWIANQKGIKKDEVFWTGLEDWLALQPPGLSPIGPTRPKVYKEEILNFLDNKGVRVTEVVLGDQVSANALRRKSIEDLRQLYAKTYGGTVDEEVMAMSKDELVSALEPDEQADPAMTSGAKYARYQLPGGENYREVLLTLPTKAQPKIALTNWRVERFSEKNGADYDGWEVNADMPDGGVFRSEIGLDTAATEAEAIEQAKRVANGHEMTDAGKPINYRSPHFNILNILAHIRVNDRTDADGKRVLFVEEIQSDWGQEGKKKGFAPRNAEAQLKAGEERMARRGEEIRRISDRMAALTDEQLDEFNRLADERQRLQDEQGAEIDLGNSIYDARASGVPAAPFVSARQYVVYKDGKELVTKNKEGKDVRHRYDRAETAQAAAEEFDGEVRDMGLQASTEGWLNLALKKIMMMAAEGGYDRVAFINGEQSADRYDLSKKVDSISVFQRKDEGGDYRVTVFKKGSDRPAMRDKRFTESELSNYFGKELADKIIKGEGGQKDNGRTWYTGVDLKVGGEGMKTFYDQIVPAAVKKLLPKVGGGVVREIPVSIKKERGAAHDAQYRLALKTLNDIGGADTVKAIPNNRVNKFIADMAQSLAVTEASIGEAVRELRGEVDDASQQPGFDVTPKMREFVGGGMPLFQPLAPYEAGQVPVGRPATPNLDDAIRKFQDRNIDIKRIIDSFKEKAGTLLPAFNPYLQEGLSRDRKAAQEKAFEQFELLPMLLEMAKRKVSLAELEEYLHARHAPDYNEEMAKRNPNKEQLDKKMRELNEAINKAPQGSVELQRLQREKEAWSQVKPFSGTEEERNSLSGMSTKEAEAHLNNLPADKKADIEAVATMVDKMVQKTGDLVINSGADPASIRNPNFRFYVPLKREGFEESGGGYGQGFSVTGKFIRTATGSRRKVVDIISNISEQRIRAINRAENNRVANALLGFVLSAPNPELWTVDKVGKVPRLDRTTGAVVMRPDPEELQADNIIVARVPDGSGGVIERKIVFNPGNETSVRIANAFRRNDTDGISEGLAKVAIITRWFANMSTQYNPIFGGVNFIRDLQSSAVRLTATPLAGKQAELIGTAIKVIPSLYKDLRARRKGERRDSQYAEIFKEFEAEGGRTLLRTNWEGSAEKTKELQKIIQRAGEQSAAGRAVQLPGRVKDIVADWLTDYNDTLESAIRLAAYKMSRDQGISKPEAAMIAKDITVNFSRKGTATDNIGALYAFFNASVQGTANMANTLDVKVNKNGVPVMGRRGQKIVAGGVLLGVIQGLLYGLADYEEGEPPDFVKEKNLVIPFDAVGKIGEAVGITQEERSNRYFSIPIALGYNFFPNIGRIATELALGGFKDPGKKAGEAVKSAFDAFSPIGAAMSLQLIAPTAADPIVALMENKDWTGKPIYRESFDRFASEPGFKLARDNASFAGIYISRALNYMSGGTEYSSGVFPTLLSPTPDQIDYLIGQAFGGIGRELTKIQKTAAAQITGEELPAYSVPVLSRFFGEVRNQASHSQAFYDNVKLLIKHQQELKGREEAGEDPNEYIARHPEAEISDQARKVMREVQQLRKEKREKIAEGIPKEEVREYDEGITQIMAQFNDEVRLLRSLK